MLNIEDETNVKNYIDEVLSFNNTICKQAKLFISSNDVSYNMELPVLGNIDRTFTPRDGGKIKKEITNSKGVSPVKDMSHWLAHYLYKKIIELDVICIFDDVMGTEGDLVGFEKTSFINKHEEMVHIACKRNISSKNELMKLIFASKVSWHFVCVIAYTDKGFTTPEYYETDSLKVKEVVIGACDGEAFIVVKKLYEK